MASTTQLRHYLILTKYPWDEMVFHLTWLNVQGMLCLASLLSLARKGLAAEEQGKTFLLHQSVDGSSFQLRAKRPLFISESCLLTVSLLVWMH